MEESDVNSLCTISLARFKREDKLKFAIEYQEAQANSEEENEERFWISDEEDNESNVRGYEDDDVRIRGIAAKSKFLCGVATRLNYFFVRASKNISFSGHYRASQQI